jgi:hypothetical protein
VDDVDTTELTVRRIDRGIERLEVKVDELRETAADHKPRIAALERRADAHAERIAALQQRAWAWGGAVALLAVLVPLAARYVGA